jgi:hypothetical protein
MNNNRVITVLLTVLLVVLLIKAAMAIGGGGEGRHDRRATRQTLVFISINPKTYSEETQKNIEETFFNLLLLKELLDGGNKETRDAILPSIMESLTKLVAKIQPVIDYEKEIIVKIDGQMLKMKKDGMGNICFGSPVYFMCLNAASQKIYPYVNDILVVFHILSKKSRRETAFPHVEELLDIMLSNIFKCPDGSTFAADYKSDKMEDVLLAKIFNSNLDIELQSMLMMIIMFMSKNPILNGVENMSNNGTFVVSNYLKEYLQQFYPQQFHGNYISYHQMKHALFNICYFKYTVDGYSALIKDEDKRKKKKDMIDANLAVSMCKTA